VSPENPSTKSQSVQYSGFFTSLLRDEIVDAPASLATISRINRGSHFGEYDAG
jgi:hypothetical protein